MFVFHAGSTATVYDADSFELLGTPTVGSGAVQAIGVPDPDTPTRLLKIFVITTDTVVILDPDPPFAVLATLRLGAAINAGENSAMLAPDGRTLLVMAGSEMHAIDALDDGKPIAQAVALNATITGLAVRPDSARAFATTAGSDTVKIINLLRFPPHLLAGPIKLPIVPTALAMAPNGFDASARMGAQRIRPAAAQRFKRARERSACTCAAASKAGSSMSSGTRRRTLRRRLVFMQHKQLYDSRSFDYPIARDLSICSFLSVAVILYSSTRLIGQPVSSVSAQGLDARKTRPEGKVRFYSN